MRDRLIELLDDTLKEWECDVQPETVLQIAEYLLENGVIVPPCKVGDTVYLIKYGDVIELVVRDLLFDTKGLYSLVASRKDQHQRCTFEYNRFRGDLEYIKFTREQAEKALAEVADGTR